MTVIDWGMWIQVILFTLVVGVAGGSAYFFIKRNGNNDKSNKG